MLHQTAASWLQLFIWCIQDHCCRLPLQHWNKVCVCVCVCVCVSRHIADQPTEQNQGCWFSYFFSLYCQVPLNTESPSVRRGLRCSPMKCPAASDKSSETGCRNETTWKNLMMRVWSSSEFLYWSSTCYTWMFLLPILYPCLVFIQSYDGRILQCLLYWWPWL